VQFLLFVNVPFGLRGDALAKKEYPKMDTKRKIAVVVTAVSLAAAGLRIFTDTNTLLREGVTPTIAEIWSRISYRLPFNPTRWVAVSYDQRGNVFIEDAHSLKSDGVYAALKRCRMKSKQSETCKVLTLGNSGCYSLVHRTNLGKWARRGYFIALGKSRSLAKQSALKLCENGVDSIAFQNRIGECKVEKSQCYL